jgi:hypothetical protein
MAGDKYAKTGTLICTFSYVKLSDQEIKSKKTMLF